VDGWLGGQVGLGASFEFFLLGIAGDELVSFILSGLNVVKKFGVTGIDVNQLFEVGTGLEVIDGVLS
jgi:hypothetical protein